MSKYTMTTAAADRIARAIALPVDVRHELGGYPAGSVYGPMWTWRTLIQIVKAEDFASPLSAIHDIFTLPSFENPEFKEWLGRECARELKNKSEILREVTNAFRTLGFVHEDDDR